MVSNSTGDTLYIGGLIFLGSQAEFSIAVFRYSNGTWDTLGVFNQDVQALVVHRDTLFAGGFFSACSGQPCAGIAYHDGSNWQPYGDLGSEVRRLRVINDTLYAVGYFETADGLPAPGVARRIGNQWEGIGQIDIQGTGSLSVGDIAKYNDELVTVGPMTVNGLRGIFHLVGNDWLPLGPGILGGLSGAGNLMVYQDDLYVTGQFSPEQGNAGNEIMRWDGTQFHPLGSGLQAVPGSNAPCSGGRMIVHDGLLWVGSGCNYAGGVPAKGMATWDGTQWCGVPGDLGGETLVRDLGFYQDTLFLAFIDGFGPMAGAAKFIGESYVGECGLWVGMEGGSAPTHTFRLYPNPASTTATLELDVVPRGAVVVLLDALGREHLRLAVHGHYNTLALHILGDGIYTVELFSGERRIGVKRLVVQR